MPRLRPTAIASATYFPRRPGAPNQRAAKTRRAAAAEAAAPPRPTREQTPRGGVVQRPPSTSQ
eukprot:9798794-Lingulodinium_polyedra.AAC.1